MCVYNPSYSSQVLDELAASKLENKKRLALYLKERQGIDVDVNTMFDIQVPDPPLVQHLKIRFRLRIEELLGLYTYM